MDNQSVRLNRVVCWFVVSFARALFVRNLDPFVLDSTMVLVTQLNIIRRSHNYLFVGMALCSNCLVPLIFFYSFPASASAAVALWWTFDFCHHFLLTVWWQSADHPFDPYLKWVREFQVSMWVDEEWIVVSLLTYKFLEINATQIEWIINSVPARFS